MKITNKHGLIRPLYLALAEDEYSSGGADYSVSELISPPLLTHLKKKHADELECDAMDNLWRVFGTIGHQIITKHAKGLVEHRFFHEVDGLKISGQPDIITGEGELYDLKIQSVWKIKKKDYKDWTAQLNLYDLLAEKSSLVDIRSLRVIALLRDWSAGFVGIQKNYPELPIQQIEITRWSRSEQEEYLKERIRLHESDSKALCTSSETWGGKRCKRYCDVKLWCPKYFDKEVNK